MDFMEETTARAMIAGQKEVISTQAAQIEALTNLLMKARHAIVMWANDPTKILQEIDAALSNTGKN